MPAHDYDLHCLYLRPNGVLASAPLQELLGICKERIFIFIDNAADRAKEIQSFVKAIGEDGKKLTLILAERSNEWNVSGSPLSPLIHTEHELKYLSSKEIDSLLFLLERHNALGTLEEENLEDRRKALTERAGRQLLVALHEATLGRPFEEIIENEYRKIVPLEAQQIYLTICSLNRMDIRVRAGIISRIHGVPFADFKNRLFGPLEHVVQADYDSVIRDYTYRARHPYIAQLVFDRVLHSAEERYEVYVRCLRELNIDYSSDRLAYRQMVRGRSIVDIFPNHELALSIFGIAKNVGGEDAFLLHQMALYEMNRQNGNLKEASDLLSKAQQVSHYDQALAIKHSMAELQLRLAEQARTPLEREKCLTEAGLLAQGLKAARSEETYAHHTLVKIGLLRLRDVLGDSANTASTPVIETLTREIERNLLEGFQLNPNHPYLLDAEAQLANLFEDSSRALEALQKAFRANPRSTFIALRLSSYYKKHDDLGRSKQVLEEALGANPGEAKLHYAFSKLLIAEKSPSDVLLYHLKRSFTEGDSNYDAQLLYGRQLFISGELEAAKQMFRRLGDAKVSHEVRMEMLYPLEQTFSGSIAKVEATYVFILRDGPSDWIHAHMNNINDDVWERLFIGLRVTFRIAFTMKGPSAFDLTVS